MGDRGRGRPLLALVAGYLIVTMQSRSTDANSIFFLQLLLTPALVFAVASAWHFARGPDLVQRRARAPAAGRGIGRPADHGAADRRLGPGRPTRRSSARARRSPSTRPRFGAYLIDLVAVGDPHARSRSSLGIGLRRPSAAASARCSLIAGVAGGILVNLGYFAYFWSHGGVTPGMRPVHLQVVHEAATSR